MGQGSVSEDHRVNYIAALDATHGPKGAIATVAFQISTQFVGHVPAAPQAALLSGWFCFCSYPRYLGKHAVHVNLLSMVFIVFLKLPDMPCTCVLYPCQGCYHPGSFPSLNGRRPWSSDR